MLSVHKKWVTFLLVVVMALSMTGCGQSGSTGASGTADGTAGGAATGKAAAEQEMGPLTLSIFQQGASISDDEYNNLIIEPIKKKYPSVTLQLIRTGKGTTREDLIAAGSFPDIVFSSAFDFYGYLDLGIPIDLSSYIKKYQFDVNQFQPSAVQQIRSYGTQGQFYALPFSMNFSAIYYNKDIFDTLAIPYLKDGMDWNQLINVAKQISAKGGDRFHPFGITNLDRMSYNLQRVDLKTKKATLTGSDWTQVFNLVKSIKEIPNNEVNSSDNFFKNKDLGMLLVYGANFLGAAETAAAEGNMVKWDVVSYPAKQTPGQDGVESQIHTFMVSSASKHPDEAFRIISYITSNKDILTAASKQGRMPALNNKDVQNVYAADLKSTQGTNISTIFKQKYAPNLHPSRYDRALAPALQDAEKAVTTQGLDINTALRQAEEKANQIIAEMDAAGTK
jgi:multiple sugar transport system substrate-binding protein